MTTKPSVAGLGDSVLKGYNDIYSDSNCYLGAFARAVGPTLAYANLSITGENAYNFVAGHANRAIVASYATSIFVDYGTNDLFNGQSLSQLIASLTTIHGYFPTQPFWQTTLLPRTTASDFWISAVNQVAVFAPLGASVRETFNSNLRSGAYTFNTGGYFDWTNPLEGSATNNVTGVNTGLWRWDGVYDYLTADGVHPNSAGNLLMIPTINTALIH